MRKTRLQVLLETAEVFTEAERKAILALFLAVRVVDIPEKHLKAVGELIARVTQ